MVPPSNKKFGRRVMAIASNGVGQGCDDRRVIDKGREKRGDKTQTYKA